MSEPKANTTSGVPVDLVTEYRLFETAPARVREFMRNSFFDWKMPTSKQIGADTDAYIDMMMRADISHSKAKAQVWGDADGWIAAQGARRRRDWTDQPPKNRSARKAKP